MKKPKIRYAVVGLGHIAQTAVLPAFAHSENSEVVALVSGEEQKLSKLGRKYKGVALFSYEEFDAYLDSHRQLRPEDQLVDAVYIALPNHLHHELALRVASAGIHILCEKPMALTVSECEGMIRAAEKHSVRLMIAYRLHFEESNLRAIQLGQEGKLGTLRFFQSTFSFPVQEDNIRLNAESGGPLYDIGIYCINAARYLFRDEPFEVFATSVRGPRERRNLFKEVDETVTAILKFPGDRLATFTCSFNAPPIARYELVGTDGQLVSENAYEYSEEITHRVTIQGRTREKTYGKRDQFAPELIYFSNCILNERDPEPNGLEGLADIRVIEALQRSIELGRPQEVRSSRQRQMPGLKQEIHRPPVKEPKPVKAEKPYDDDEVA